MEGSWQAGHLSAEDYTKKALEAAKIMRWVDPSIKLVACGSSYEMLPTYMAVSYTHLDVYKRQEQEREQKRENYYSVQLRHG